LVFVNTLVTGANGFIGSRFLQQDDRGMTRSISAEPNIIQADLLDANSLISACDGIDRIFHCAGYAHAFSSTDINSHWRINYEGTCNLLNAAGRAGVRSFVFLSSVKAMAEPGEKCVSENWPGDPITPYGLAKRAAEDAVIQAGLKYDMHVVNLRLAMVYGKGGRGNLERMARAIRSGWFPPLPETGNKRSLVHVQDVVTAMRLVADRPEANGKTFIVADSQAYSGRQIYDVLRRELGFSKEPVFTIPTYMLRATSRLNHRLKEIIDRLISSACYSPQSIEHELGWRAQMSLAEGVREMLSNY
jgi:UDP-glucose 4-epimerase